MQVTYKDQVPANGRVRNALADTDLAIAPHAGFLTIYGRQAATASGELEVSFSQGSTEIVVESPLTQNDNLTPNRQDNIVAGPIPILPGKSLRSKIQEVAGVATNLNVLFDLVEADVSVVLRAMGVRG